MKGPFRRIRLRRRTSAPASQGTEPTVIAPAQEGLTQPLPAGVTPQDVAPSKPGFRDRGRLRPGLRADLNLIDFEALRLHQPEIVHDLPTGARRLVQRVDGYRATLVAGTPVFEHGEDTGARPGRLVRAGR